MIAASLFLLALVTADPATGGSAPAGGPRQLPCATNTEPCPWKEAFADKVTRSWNPNCAVDGGAQVRLRVSLILNSKGWPDREPEIYDENHGTVIDLQAAAYGPSSVVGGAAIRARSAIMSSAPFVDVPPELVGRRIVVRFNAAVDCR